MKLRNDWTQIAVIPATQIDPTAIIGINDGKLYVTYDVDSEPPEAWVWAEVSIKTEE